MWEVEVSMVFDGTTDRDGDPMNSLGGVSRRRPQEASGRLR
jgi:hypothetical protein